jgi:Common central domain of tyrosinase/Clostridial hydrophobic W
MPRLGLLLGITFSTLNVPPILPRGARKRLQRLDHWLLEVAVTKLCTESDQVHVAYRLKTELEDLKEKNMALGDGIRRDVTTVSQAERDRLRDAIIALHTIHYPGGRGDVPVGGVSVWFKQDEIHDSTHVHQCPAFLPWHRELVNRFEASIRQVDPDLSLHYWDWTTSPLSLFTPNFMGSPSGPAGAPWLSAGFYGGGGPFRDITGNSFDTPQVITRAAGSGAPVTTAEDSAIVNAVDFQDLNTKLTQAHNNAHGFIGGTIGNPHTSFRDPFVFLLHSNVDRLFAMWQRQPSQPGRLNPNLIYGIDSNSQGSGDVSNLNPFWGILSPLEPWAGPNAQLPSTGVILNVQATRPWFAPENQQTVKDSMHPSVVAPPLYDSTNLKLDVLVHLQGIGDTTTHDDQFAGTRGQSRRLEGFQLFFNPQVPGLSMQYMAHLQGIGDAPFVNEGQFIGTRGQSRRLEGFAIQLTGPAATSFDVVYMAHLQGSGDTPFFQNGQFCGTRGQSRRVEGILVRVSPH